MSNIEKNEEKYLVILRSKCKNTGISVFVNEIYARNGCFCDEKFKI